MRPAYGVVAAALAVAILVVRPVLGMHGLPAFYHDWSWPPDPLAAWTAFTGAASAYSPNNFGQYNFYIQGAPDVFVIAISVALFGALTGLHVFLLGMVATAFLSAFSAARRFGASTSSAGALALAYAASPVVGTEIAAGHMLYLFGYAALPAVAECGRRIASGDVRKRIFVALLVTVVFSAGQPQFIAFDALLLALFLPVAQTTRARLAVAGAVACTLLVAPYDLVLTLIAHPLTALSADRANVHWEAANSSSLWQAYVGGGYLGSGDRTIPPLLWLGRAAGGVILWAIAIASVVWSRRWIGFLLLALLAAWLSAGVNGPLWPLMTSAIVHVPQLALFRELYHFSVLVIAGLIVLCATSNVPRKKLILTLGALLFALPNLAGYYWKSLPSYDPAEIAAVHTRIAREGAAGFILYWPLLQPMGPGAQNAGTDPDAFAVGANPSLSEFVPTQPLSQLEPALCGASPARAVQLLRDFGVRYVVIRTAWRSYYQSAMEPGLRELAGAHAPRNCSGDRLMRKLGATWRGRSHTLAVINNPKAVVNGRPSADVWRFALERPFDPSAVTADPRVGWVDATRWQWWDPIFAGPVDPGVFTIGTLSYDLPPDAPGMSMLLNAPAGVFLNGPKVHVVIPPTRGYQWIGVPPGVKSVQPLGATVLVGLGHVSGTVRLPARGARAPVGDCAALSGEAVSALPACPRVGLEILNGSSTPWTLTDRGGRAVPPVATAWDLQWDVPAGGAPYRLGYALPPPLALALALQYVIWAGAITGILGLLGYILRTHHVAPHPSGHPSDL